MRDTALSAFFVALFAWAFAYSLTETLDDLTRKDCEAGVVKACEALARSK